MYIVKYNALNADGVFIKIEYKDLKMSLLSKSQITKLTLALESMQELIGQESKNIENKISLAVCRLNCVQQKLDIENQNNLHQAADLLMTLRGKVTNAKDKNSQLYDKYTQNLKTVKDDINKQLNELQSNTKSSRDTRMSQFRILEQKLDLQLQKIEEDHNEERQSQQKQVQILQNKVLQQLHGCQQKIMLNRKGMQNEEEKLIKKTQQIGKDLFRKISQLREARKIKKANFLELLESIIIKIKDIQTDV